MASQLTTKTMAGTTCFLDKLLRRGLISSIYPESQVYKNKLRNMLQTPVSIYAGFDATSESLHVGNLATIMNLIQFQRHGHHVLCVIGDATTQIGDPSGHSKDRPKIDRLTINKNADAIEETLTRIFKNHKTYFQTDSINNTINFKDPTIVRNSQWYANKNVIDFVGEVFKEVRVGWLLHKKSISDRLKSEEGLNLSELCYQIFQAHDWMELRRLYDCKLQLGGSDQAGNIYTGHDLIKKRLGATDSIGLLAPLITNSETGKKLGKSSDTSRSNIWLRPQNTSPYNLYQFFVRTPDKDVERLLKVFSLHDETTIENLIYKHLKKPEDVWYCQRKLANHVCKLVHGQEGLESAKRLTHAFFHQNPTDIANLSDEELHQLFDQDSIIKLVHQDDLRVLDLTRRAGCFNSDYDAERIISSGALWINGVRVNSFNVPITRDLIIGNDITIMRIGKRNYYLFKWLR